MSVPHKATTVPADNTSDWVLVLNESGYHKIHSSRFASLRSLQFILKMPVECDEANVRLDELCSMRYEDAEIEIFNMIFYKLMLHGKAKLTVPYSIRSYQQMQLQRTRLIRYWFSLNLIIPVIEYTSEPNYVLCMTTDTFGFGVMKPDNLIPVDGKTRNYMGLLILG